MKLHEEIMALLKKRVEMEHEYINPNFLQEITAALEDHYNLEDDAVDVWVTEMFGAQTLF